MASKVLLVEDDNNLREIYQARLQAEGYDIVSAKDGEEALVIAKQEQPDLIISDVMMPRVSGFEMLDILRNTEGLKDPKVIMLTALGQADDKNRADQLGADRYLVKSQVTLEDIVKAAQDLLNGASSDDAADKAAVDAMTTPTVSTPVVADVPVVPPPPATPAPTPEPTPPPAPAPEPVAAAPASQPQEDVQAAPPVTDAPIEPDATPAPTTPGTDAVVTQAVEASPNEDDPNDQLIADALKDLTSDAGAEAATSDTTNNPIPVEPPATPEPTPPPAPAPEPPVPPVQDDDDDSSPVAHKKVIRPITEPSANAQPDINELLAKEEAKNDASETLPTPPPAPAPEPVAATPASQPQEDVQAAPPHQPGHVISPTPSVPEPPVPAVEQPVAPVSEIPTAPVSPEGPAPTAGNDTDLNSIAL